MKWNKLLAKKIISWVLLGLVIVYLITGFGITQYRIVEAITFGMLSKMWSFRIHSAITLPFIIILVAHICLSLNCRKKK